MDSNLEDPRRWVFAEEGQDFGVRVDGRFQANSARSVREMLLAGEGIGLCPYYAVEGDLQTGKLVLLLQEYLATEYGIYAVYPHNRHLAAKVRTFVDFLAMELG